MILSFNRADKCYFGMESVCELLGTLLLPGKKTQTMKTEMAKAISLHLIPAEFQREVLIAVFLDTASSCFEVPVIIGFSSFMSL